MSAIQAMIDETVRLYSRQRRLPVDVVAPAHAVLHAELDAWGRWCRERTQRGTCESIEHSYDETGGRQARAPQISLPENPRHRELDSIVRHLRMTLPQHGEAIRLFYAGQLARRLVYVRVDPTTICRMLHLRYEDFAAFMFDSRAAVLNLLRRYGTE